MLRAVLVAAALAQASAFGLAPAPALRGSGRLSLASRPTRFAAPGGATKLNALGNLFGGGNKGGGGAAGTVTTKVFFDIEIGGKPVGECRPQAASQCDHSTRFESRQQIVSYRDVVAVDTGVFVAVMPRAEARAATQNI